MFDHDTYCLEGEEWRDIPSYEGIYQASSFGRIRTVDGKTTHSVKHGVRTWKGKVLKSRGSNPTTGYRVTLWKDKQCKDALVARLVCISFHGAPDNPKMTVNHIDGNRFNNRIENLEWLTLEDNIRHGFDTGLYPSKRIKLKIGDEVQEFKSLSSASRHMGRPIGYASLCLQKNIRMRTRQGEPVEIIPF